MMTDAGSGPNLPPPDRASTGAWIIGLGVFPAVILAIGWIDVVTGHEIGLSLFYLGPIGACGWYMGRRAAIGMAAFASATWLAADLGARLDGNVLVSSVNSLTRFGIFIVVGVLTALVHADRNRLKWLLEQERELAHTDGLTGLANSRAFLAAVGTELARAQRASHSVCLAYLDLDNFKRVNDVHGHAEGDALLVSFARVIREEFRATDLVARLGGDEFAVLLWNLDVLDVRRLAQRVLERGASIGQRYEGLGLGVSIGVAYFAEALEDPEEVIRKADAAMYSAKAAGKGTVTIVQC
jgi:diguanylate cyclase (GGDEF)-like protein